MNRRVLVNLVFFASVFAVMMLWAVNNIVTIDRIENPYKITGEFAQAAGIRSNAEVTYLGVHYGRVTGVSLREGGVLISMKIDRDKDIPAGAIARIFRKSAIGEPYIDFAPPREGDTATGKIEPGDRIRQDNTTVPLEFSELLRSASKLVGSINPESAGSLVHELALGLDGRGQDLRDLTTSFDAITATFASRTDELDRLAENSTRITRVLADHRLSIGQSITNLREVADGLRNSKGDLEALFRDGPGFLTVTADLVADQKANLDCLLTDLAPVLHVAGANHLDDLATLLEQGPLGFGYVFASVDREPDGPWIRVNLALPVGGTDPKIYTPRATLPVVPSISPCSSSMTPASVFPTRSAGASGATARTAPSSAATAGASDPTGFSPRTAAEVLAHPADVGGSGAPVAAVAALTALAGALAVLGHLRRDLSPKAKAHHP